MIPAKRKRKKGPDYPRSFATNLTIHASVQALLVGPPSHMAVLYSLATGGTIFDSSMFMAGVCFPGGCAPAFRLDNSFGPGHQLTAGQPSPWTDRWRQKGRAEDHDSTAGPGAMVGDERGHHYSGGILGGRLHMRFRSRRGVFGRCTKKSGPFSCTHVSYRTIAGGRGTCPFLLPTATLPPSQWC